MSLTHDVVHLFPIAEDVQTMYGCMTKRWAQIGRQHRQGRGFAGA